MQVSYRDSLLVPGIAAAALLGNVRAGTNGSSTGRALEAPCPTSAAATLAQHSQLSQLNHSRWKDGWRADQLKYLPCTESGYCRCDLSTKLRHVPNHVP